MKRLDVCQRSYADFRLLFIMRKGLDVRPPLGRVTLVSVYRGKLGDRRLSLHSGHKGRIAYEPFTHFHEAQQRDHTI